MNPSYEYDSQNGTPLFNLTQRIEPFSKYYSKNWTLFNIWLEELNIFFKRTFSIWLKGLKCSICFEELNPFLIWPEELTFLEKWVKYLNPFWKWLKELNFFHMIQIIEPYFKIGSQNWIFWSYFKYWVFFQKKNSKNWKNWTLLGYHSKDWTFFSWKIWLKELNSFFSQFDSKNCSNLSFSWFKYLDLFHMTQILEPSFLRDSNTWTFLKIFDSKKWTFFFKTQSFFLKKKTHRIEFFKIRPTELIVFVNWTV